jgi:hypothetical protein
MAEIKDPNQISIELNEEVAQGIYSNLAVITHSPSEFVVDFVRIMPGIPKAQVKSRIILTPDTKLSIICFDSLFFCYI